MFLVAPRPIVHTPLVKLIGRLPFNRPSRPQPDGTRLLLVGGCWPLGRQVVPVCHAQHGRQIARGELLATRDELLLDVQLDPARPAHAEILRSLRCGDVWGISPDFKFSGDRRISVLHGPITEVLRVTRCVEVTLTRCPLFDSSLTLLENRPW